MSAALTFLIRVGGNADCLGSTEVSPSFVGGKADCLGNTDVPQPMSATRPTVSATFSCDSCVLQGSMAGLMISLHAPVTFGELTVQVNGIFGPANI